MSSSDAPEPSYNAPAGGAYTTEEHLRGQAEQKSDAKPGVLVGDTDPTRTSAAEPSTADVPAPAEPAAPAEAAEPAAPEGDGAHAATTDDVTPPPPGDGTGEVAPEPLG